MISAKEYNKKVFSDFPELYTYYKSILQKYIKPGSKILDIGSGPATLGFLLIGSGLDDISIYCVDKNRDYISQAMSFDDNIYIYIQEFLRMHLMFLISLAFTILTQCVATWRFMKS